MIDKPKRWQMQIWTGSKFDQPIAIYAEELSQLPMATMKWLKENPLSNFSNASPDQNISRRISYSYSDGTKRVALPLSAFFKGETLDEGWWYVQGGYGRPNRLDSYDEVVEHLVRHGLLPQKGPDYQELTLVENQIPLHLIKTVRRESEELQANEMLYRGWYIIALEFDGKLDMFDEKIVSRKTVFVLALPLNAL